MASASLPQGNQTPLLLRLMAQGWGGGTAWPRVLPCRDHAHSEVLWQSPLHPSGTWGARDQRQCCLENGVLNQLQDVMLILFCWVGSGKSDPPSLPQFPHLPDLCRPLFL